MVSERLGHKSIGIALKNYAHALPSMQQKAAAAIESIYPDCPMTVPQATMLVEKSLRKPLRFLDFGRVVERYTQGT